MIVYISIGNSDDKLTQADWSSYVLDVDRAFDASVRYEGARVHGRWYSLPTEPWQNACWCAEWHEDLAHVVEALKRKLASTARAYRQDSIAWAVVVDTEFLGPTTFDSATATSMRAAVDGLPALASSPGEVGSPASPAVQHPATANRPAPLRPGT